jgi:4,5-dihydroxyphthalate decarboxylase
MDITIALERYDRHVPFFDGSVKAPKGLSYKALQVGQTFPLRDGINRHENMLHEKLYDVAEFSMSTFLMAIDRKLPIVGIPVFPRRLFSSGLIYVRADSPIRAPRELIGRRVVINSFQTTLSLLAKGDLKFEYDTPWEEITWLIQNPEKIAFRQQPGVKTEPVPRGADVGHMLRDGACDAVLLPHPPDSIMQGEVKVRRLFEDPDAEELRYFKKYGYWPIMHIVAMWRDLADAHPWLPEALMKMFAEAREISADYYTDPNYSQLAWGRRYFERERLRFGTDNLWPIGVAANRRNLEQFIAYSKDQGLIEGEFAVDDLFHERVRGT